MSLLVTGGCGFIGAHTCVELINAGYELIAVDNFSNSSSQVVSRIRELTGDAFRFCQADLLDREALDRIFAANRIDAVIHLAGLKSVGESVANPLAYYKNNVTGTLTLLETMRDFGVKRLVFSSSATVYGRQKEMPIPENVPLEATNPYGRTKLMVEYVLKDLCASDPDWSVVLLRYFNPVGAHGSGRLGEQPAGVPSNLAPYITQVAAGKLPELTVFGNYPTPDGTGIRDFIHVMDLADGHVKAVRKALSTTGIDAYNLGTGKGYSVFEVLRAFEQLVGRPIPYSVADRRPGDVAVSYADPSKARRELGWVAERDLEEMCRDAWRWQLSNPNGYEEA